MLNLECAQIEKNTKIIIYGVELLWQSVKGNKFLRSETVECGRKGMEERLGWMATERERGGSGSERENVSGGGEEVKSTCGVSG